MTGISAGLLFVARAPTLDALLKHKVQVMDIKERRLCYVMYFYLTSLPLTPCMGPSARILYKHVSNRAVTRT